MRLLGSLVLALMHLSFDLGVQRYYVFSVENLKQLYFTKIHMAENDEFPAYPQFNQNISLENLWLQKRYGQIEFHHKHEYN